MMQKPSSPSFSTPFCVSKMEDDDDDRSNPQLMPSNYVTLVQLQERWLQEKQRKPREKEEQEEQERKQKIDKEEREEERQKHKERQKPNLQMREAKSITTLPRRNQRPPLLTNRWIPSEKSSTQFGAVVIYDGESKTDAFVKKKKKKKNREKRKQMRRKPRGEEDLIGGMEQLFVQKEYTNEENPVVSTESDCGKQIGGKCEAVSSSGGKRGNGRYRSGVKNRGKPRVEEDLNNVKEQLAKNEVEAENILVASNERECEKEGVTSEFAEIGRKCLEVSSGGGTGRNGGLPRGVKKWANKRVEKDLNIDEVEAGDFAVVSIERERKVKGNGKSLVMDGRVWEKKVMGGDGSVGGLGKFEGLSMRGRKGGNERFSGDINGGSRRCSGGYGRFVNRPRVERLTASNLVWVKKEEGESSDANAAGV